MSETDSHSSDDTLPAIQISGMDTGQVFVTAVGHRFNPKSGRIGFCVDAVSKDSRAPLTAETIVQMQAAAEIYGYDPDGDWDEARFKTDTQLYVRRIWFYDLWESQ